MLRLAQILEDHLVGKSTPVPEPDRLLFGWFADLCRTRTYHAAGPHPISYAEIESYARLMRWPLEPCHVEMIRELDAVWMTHAGRPSEHIRNGGLHIRPDAPVLTPAAFDAVSA